jgi:DNA-3-methyladenine glycosylase
MSDVGTSRDLVQLLSGQSWEVAPMLLGWRFETLLDGVTTALVLTEVEAYDQTDAASHSYAGETKRTRPMFGPPGHLYVYRSYGVHWCVNIVTGPAGHGAAVLLRGGRPVEGVGTMARRRGRADHLADGPGKLTQAMGLTGSHDGIALGDLARLTPTDARPTVVATPRVGISKAVELPWRFVTVDDVTSG